MKQWNRTLMTAIGIAAFLCVTTNLTRAEYLSYPITQALAGGAGNWGLWDVTRIANLHRPVIEDEGVVLQPYIDFLQNSRGRIIGSGYTPLNMTMSGVPIPPVTDARYSVSGYVRTSRGQPYIYCSARFSSRVLVPFETRPRTVAASATLRALCNPVDHTVSGNVAMSASVSRLGRYADSFPIPDMSFLNGLNDGSWNLNLDLTTTGSRVTGDASVDIMGFRAYTLRIRGTHSDQTGISKLNLIGVNTRDNANSGLGCRLTVYLQDVAGVQHLTRVTGRVGGQTINLHIQ